MVGAAAVAVAAAGASGALVYQASSDANGEAVQIVAESQNRVPALSCDEVQKLDQQTAERASVARTAIPNIEKWPPIEVGMDPNERPPAAAPLDPESGIPKDQLEQETPPEALEQQRKLQAEAARKPIPPRPCGEDVDKIRAEVEKDLGGTLCYLPDGRFGTAVYVDFAPIDPNAKPERLPQEYFDQLCQSRGWDRGHQ